MELLLIPVLLAAGLVLTYLGANGVSTPQPVAESASDAPPAAAYVAQERPLPSDGPPPARRAISMPMRRQGTSITQSDVLLADVLTEMIELRSQFAELQRKVASLKSDVAQLATGRERPRTRRTRIA